MRHFFPDFPKWVDAMPDTRLQELVVYRARFLMIWGVSLFTCKLGSKRQLDFQLRELDSEVLNNLNRLAGTTQASLPVDGTLDHYLDHLGPEPLESIRTQMVNRLIRMRVVDDARLLGRVVVAVDGTGWLNFRQHHCSRCMWQKHGDTTLFFHHVLEGKILGPAGTVFSIGTEFMENTGSLEDGEVGTGDVAKQDCELKAMARLAPRVRAQFPQLKICLSSDSLAGCGPAMQIAKDNRMNFVFTFKEGRMPSAWEEFQQLLELCPENRLTITLPDGTTQVYRWVQGLTHVDTDRHHHVFNAIECVETSKGVSTRFAWMTDLPVTHKTVLEIASKGGRARWNIENQGFNIQKNNGFNLEHAYSENIHRMKAYYLLLQIAHMILQLLEKGSLLRNHARKLGKTVPLLLGSIKNIAVRLLEALRHIHIPDDAFDPVTAASIQIRLSPT